MLLGFFTIYYRNGGEMSFCQLTKTLCFMTVWHDTFTSYNLKFW